MQNQQMFVLNKEYKKNEKNLPIQFPRDAWYGAVYLENNKHILLHHCYVKFQLLPFIVSYVKRISIELLLNEPCPGNSHKF
jgi:hypothetical protein